jgi:hypothetical protein
MRETAVHVTNASRAVTSWYGNRLHGDPMPIAFKADRYGVQVVHKWTSPSGRWTLFLGTHFDGTHQCWDMGAFQNPTGACQRLHFKDNKTGATIEFDKAKEELTKVYKRRPPEERDKFHILGPDGKPTN